MEKYTSAPMLSDQSFERAKNESLMIYAYANRVLSMAEQWKENQSSGFGLFDRSGCLLKLYGSRRFMDFCKARSIRVRSVWNSASWEKTAVSRGIATCREARSSGKSNPAGLQDVDIFFEPINMERRNEIGTNTFLGGIALFSPVDEPVQEPKLICAALANDIVLHLFMSDELYMMYFQEPRALLTLDINMKTGAVYLLYHNEELFRTLGIPKEDLFFKRIETLFDPPPKNKRFWDMIRNRRSIVDQNMTLSIRGSEQVYTVTSHAYQQSGLRLSGIRLLLTSQRELSTHVARHIGNNAIYSFSDILGRSDSMQRCIAQSKAIARSDSNVMITGESGVGKDVFAQAIHNASHRAEKPFIVLNCAAYPRDLLASELFGYEGGAYTGAKRSGNLGKFELADGGTIFLDEIGDMPLDLQVMLLRVIEQKSFMRIGSNTERRVDVKIIAATNADLQGMIEKRTFRLDLYYRLSTLALQLPPLRERGDDILLLAGHFIGKISARTGMRLDKRFSPEARELMLRLPWSGNVRELQNVMERVVQMIPGDVIMPDDLLRCLDFPPESVPEAPVPARTRHRRQNVGREDILQALENCRYNRTLAAAALGVSRKTFYRKLEEYNIDLS
ncbi:MAG: sigma 54-interacting transcriptional regulator [Oscillospiraceae bacterium]|nr:sigma 54-interacting transcriptional regulator [Oscillospiraceae bacterium]